MSEMLHSLKLPTSASLRGSLRFQRILRGGSWSLPHRVAKAAELLKRVRYTSCELHARAQQATKSTSAVPTVSIRGNYRPEARRGIPIQPGEVHIWWLDPSKIQSTRLLQQYMNILSEPEKEFVAEGSSEGIKKERLLARTLVRTVLCRYCHGDINPEQLKFETNFAGKPYLVSGESFDSQQGQLHFNLTHTSSLLGLAVSRGALVGLDVEDSRRITKSKPETLAKRRFSEREYAVLQGFENPKEQASLFIRLWTLKEAYVKAKGFGIAASPGLRSFTFELLLSNRVKRYAAPSSMSTANAFPGPLPAASPAPHANGASSSNASSPVQLSDPELANTAQSEASDEEGSSGDSGSSIHDHGQSEDGSRLDQHGASSMEQPTFQSEGAEEPRQHSNTMAFNLSLSASSFSEAKERPEAQDGFSPWKGLFPEETPNSSATAFSWGAEGQKTPHSITPGDRHMPTANGSSTGDQTSPLRGSSGSSYSHISQTYRDEGTPEVELPLFWTFRDRTPFRIQFKQSAEDSKRWAVWLMELQGGHTSALLLEADAKFDGMDNLKVEKRLRVRSFNTVPLQSEEVLRQGEYCRAIGFGISND